MTLPPDELQRQRYADYMGTPGEWTLAYLLTRTFVPRSPAHAISDEAKFYRDAQTHEARELIRLLLVGL
jgi:hypothetical protein